MRLIKGGVIGPPNPICGALLSGRPGMNFRLEHRVGTIDQNVARFCERQAQLRLQPHDLAAFASPGATAPHIGRDILEEAIGVAHDEQAVVPM